MLKKIISGGQTGADRGALEAAIAHNFPHGGWCPKGRRAEDGIIPPQFCLQETDSTDYRDRTEMNIVDSDATIIFVGIPNSPGSQLTATLCRRRKKPYLIVDIDLHHDVIMLVLQEFLSRHPIEVLNVAGNRESKSPGIQEKVRKVIQNLI